MIFGTQTGRWSWASYVIVEFEFREGQYVRGRWAKLELPGEVYERASQRGRLIGEERLIPAYAALEPGRVSLSPDRQSFADKGTAIDPFGFLSLELKDIRKAGIPPTGKIRIIDVNTNCVEISGDKEFQEYTKREKSNALHLAEKLQPDKDC